MSPPDVSLYFFSAALERQQLEGGGWERDRSEVPGIPLALPMAQTPTHRAGVTAGVSGGDTGLWEC